MTEDVGAALKAARERMGVSLEEAEAATKIRQRFLRALEENDQSVLGGAVYVRGFLKNYASYLGLDPAVLMPAAESVIPVVTPSATAETEILSLPLRDTSFPFGRILAMVLAFVLLGVAAYYLWQPTQRAVLLEQLSAYLPVPVPSATAINAAGVVTTVTSAPTVTQSAVAVADSTPTSTPVPTATLPPRTPTPDLTATAAPTQTPEPTIPVSGIVLGVRVTAPSWTQVYLDNDEFPVIERTLTEGETFEWTGQERVFLRLGNAGGVVVTLNGQDLGTLGSPGDVVNRVWMLDSATGQVVEGSPDVN